MGGDGGRAARATGGGWGIGDELPTHERTNRLVAIAAPAIHPGQEEALRRFASAAARIMARYGGRIERVVRPTAAQPPAPLPREVHLVAFPDEAAFAAYRADPDLAALAPRRQAAIARTELIIGTEGEPYA